MFNVSTDYSGYDEVVYTVDSFSDAVILEGLITKRICADLVEASAWITDTTTGRIVNPSQYASYVDPDVLPF